MSYVHITHVFFIGKMKPDSWKIGSDFQLLALDISFSEAAHFFILEDKKNEEKCDESWSRDFHFPSKFEKWGG